MISYNFDESNIRLREILKRKGVSESRQLGHIFNKLKGTESEVTKASIGRWLRGEGVPQPKNLQEVMERLELSDGEAIYYLLGIEYTKPYNLPDYNDKVLAMRVYAAMDEYFKDNGVLYEELSQERVEGIFSALISIISLSKHKIIDKNIVDMVCRA